MVLEHAANPDLRGREYWERKPDGPNRQEIPVTSLRDASNRLRDWVGLNSLGGGNLTMDCGSIINEDGERIASISFNGRAWKSMGIGNMDEIKDLDIPLDDLDPVTEIQSAKM